MHPIVRRCYSTIPDFAAAARTSSTPRAVRLRRRPARSTATQDAPSDATSDGLTPTELARYQRALAIGGLMGPDGREPTEAEWLARLNSRRTRLRGARSVVASDGTQNLRVVGQKIYLPNIIFRLVRNHTLSGKPYNPYEATFRVPQSVTKTDIRTYLAAVYGVQTTYIRTDNYISPLIHTHGRGLSRDSSRTFKRAVVGLVEPFYYPQAIEDMSTAERDAHEKFVTSTYQVDTQKQFMLKTVFRATKKNSKDWVWRGEFTTQRGTILQRIAEQRVLRE